MLTRDELRAINRRSQYWWWLRRCAVYSPPVVTLVMFRIVSMPASDTIGWSVVGLVAPWTVAMGVRMLAASEFSTLWGHPEEHRLLPWIGMALGTFIALVLAVDGWARRPAGSVAGAVAVLGIYAAIIGLYRMEVIASRATDRRDSQQL